MKSQLIGERINLFDPGFLSFLQLIDRGLSSPFVGMKCFEKRFAKYPSILETILSIPQIISFLYFRTVHQAQQPLIEFV